MNLVNSLVIDRKNLYSYVLILFNITYSLFTIILYLRAMQEKLYNSYSDYVKRTFKNRVQKISIDAGFSCPNRDGKKGRGGCTYCNNESFNPFYCSPKKSITQQLNEGISFFEKKYPKQDYLAYFQAYSNTYAPLTKLKQEYEEALAHPRIIGLILGTRPDCVDEKLMQYLSQLSQSHYLVLEMGIESTLDRTLERINRGHTFPETIAAFELAKKYNILTGGHLILGLPGESRTDMLNHAQKIAKLPLKFLKLHQLQIIKNTAMAKDFELHPEEYNLFSLEEYVKFIPNFLKRLAYNIIIERFTSESPTDMLIAPKWGRLKNYQIVHLIENELKIRK